MTEEQRDKFRELCVDYRMEIPSYAHKPYQILRDYVETLIDEAVKGAINEHKAGK